MRVSRGMVVAALVAAPFLPLEARAIELLGLRLGQAATDVPECKVADPQARFRRYETFDWELRKPVPGPCFENFGSEIGTSLFDPEGSITFRPESRPSFLPASGGITVRLSAGMVDEIAIVTTGEASQVRVAEALIEKLGQPSSSELEEKTNAFGVRLTSISMRWVTSDGTVTFDGITSERGRGFISVLSNAARERWIEKIEADRSKDAF